MARNLLYLGKVFDNKNCNERVVKMLNNMSEATIRYPTSFGEWAAVFQLLILEINELIITGENFHNLLKDILHIFIPNKILQISVYQNENFPLLKGKRFINEPLIFLCKNYTCQAPVTDVNSLLRLLNENPIYSI